MKKLIKFIFGFLLSPINCLLILWNKGSHQLSDKNIIDAADWLIDSQINGLKGKGYSRKYSLISGWDRCYIETTGYIIPTLLDVSLYLDDAKYKESALKAAYWLLSVQKADGSFTDIDSYASQVFDTGQVLLGLNRAYKETGDERFLKSINSACSWLLEQQESNGSWIKYAYNGLPHAYYTRVAAALIEAGEITNAKHYVLAGIKNLEWTAKQRKENGFYEYSGFRTNEDPLLHTLVYILEGFSMAYRLTGDRKWADILVSDGAILLELLNDEGLLYSQYNSSWTPTNVEYCVTGLAQCAGIFFDLYEITKNPTYKTSGLNILVRLCGWQQMRGKYIKGGIQSSIPLWGYYGGMELFNWNAKFFLDAMLKNPENVKCFRIKDSSL